MDYEEEYEPRYRRYDDYYTTNNSRAYHLYDFWHRFEPYWDGWGRNRNWGVRPDKYKSRRKGRC